MQNEPRILGQYSNGGEAVTHALSLVRGFMSLDQTRKKTLASKYAPLSQGRGGAQRQTLSATVVFDIDDTLLFDVTKKNQRVGVIPHQIIVDLLYKLCELGATVHLVTARLDDEEYVKETKNELSSLNILEGTHYKTLTLAPPQCRVDMSKVSKWKMMQRKKLANDSKTGVTLTVGDQWGDMIVLSKDEKIDELDELYRVDSRPYLVVRPNDGVSFWGLKLPSYS